MYLKQFQNLRIMASKLTHIINSDHILKNNKQIYFWFIWYDIRHQYIPLIMFLQHNKVQKWVLHVTDNYEFKYNLQFLFQKTLFLALKLITSGIVKMFFNIKKKWTTQSSSFPFSGILERVRVGDPGRVVRYRSDVYLEGCSVCTGPEQNQWEPDQLCQHALHRHVGWCK